jgi:tRNA pseudouridine55 synthase
MNGLLVVDKPAGPTSHDIVAAMRRTLGESRIGHTGTLDPGASGVLPLVIGSATRLARFLSAHDKGYDASIRLGVETDTYDATGRAIGSAWTGTWPDRAEVERILNEFRGTFLQTPPAFSAKHVGGTRSHRLARHAAKDPARVAVVPEPGSVTVSRLEVVDCRDGIVTLTIECSAGFYVRALAHDLGARLKTGGHLAALRRTRSGRLTLAESVPFAAVAGQRDAAVAAITPLNEMLPDLPAIRLNASGVRYTTHGRDLGPSEFVAGASVAGPAEGRGYVRLIDEGGNLVALALPAQGGLLHPSIVLK